MTNTQTVFATFGEAFRAAMAETQGWDVHYPCAACGDSSGTMVRTPDRCASVHRECLGLWAELVADHG